MIWINPRVQAYLYTVKIWLKLSMSTSTIFKLSQPFVLEARITLHAWPTNYKQAAPSQPLPPTPSIKKHLRELRRSSWSCHVCAA